MKKVSLSTFLFLLGCVVAVLAAGLQWIIPGNQLVLFLVAVGGVALAAWQKFRGDYEQRQQLEQERMRSDAAAQDYAIRHSELRISSNLHKAPDPMPTRESQVIQRHNDAMEIGAMKWFARGGRTPVKRSRLYKLVHS